MTTASLNVKRFVELDLLRGLAVIAMVFYHVIVDLVFFFGATIPVDLFGLGWAWGSHIIAGTFLVLVGISLYIKRQRQITSQLDGRWWLSDLKRGLMIFGLGVVITIFSWVFMPAWMIWFGILQLIGASIILTLPFLSKSWVGWLGVAVIACGVMVGQLTIFPDTLILLPFGLYPLGWQSFDYFPLFPWWGVVLIGASVGQRWYAHGQRQWDIPKYILQLIKAQFSQPIIWSGRHALLIYLLHQPLLLLFFYLLFWLWP